MGINVHLAEPGRCETAALMTTTCFSIIMIKLPILAWKCSEYEATQMNFKAFFTSQHHIFLCICVHTSAFFSDLAKAQGRLKATC